MFLNLNQKHNKFEESKNCLEGNKYHEEFKNFILRSVNLEMCLQQLKKSILSVFDDKRCFINGTRSKPWN